MPRPLPVSFYRRPTLTVARELLGKIFERCVGNDVLIGRITEVEAYHEDGDEASHSFRGRTPRNAVMYRPGGCLYVYFTYGMHYCMNVVTEGPGVGAAVLIRAIEPLAGIDVMRRHRGVERLRDIASGPGKCCQAFAVGRAEDGASLRSPALRIVDAEEIPDSEILLSRRIGIRKSVELEWRMSVRGSGFVSR
ncbi:MAG: DNA-3-methyladenine glycosylase [Ignavibacteria bacterium]|nr:DNA-3-methyladenine glycosylase [Ignavibacteria bacterium]